MPRPKQAARIAHAMVLAQRPHYKPTSVIKKNTRVVVMSTGQVMRARYTSYSSTRFFHSRDHQIINTQPESFTYLVYGGNGVSITHAYLSDLLIWP